MVVPPNYLPQFWQQLQLSGVQLARAFGKRLEIPWPHSPVLKCHRMTTSPLTYLDQKLSILQNRIWFDDDWQNCLVALFQFAPVCVFLRRFAPVLHFFALVYPMWISWKVPINYKFLQKDHVVHLPTGGGCCGNESVQVLSVLVADTSLGEGGWMGKVGPFENQNAHFCHVPWARPAQVQLEYSCCQLFVKLGHGVSPGVRDSNVLVVEDVFPHHMESSIKPYIP